MNFSPSVRFGNGGAIDSIAPPGPMSQTQGIVAGAETEVMTKVQGLNLGNEKKNTTLLLVGAAVVLYFLLR